MKAIELKELLAIAQRYRKVMAAIVFGCMALSVIALFFLPPIYEARVSLTVRGSMLNEILKETATTTFNTATDTTLVLDKYMQRYVDEQKRDTKELLGDSKSVSALEPSVYKFFTFLESKEYNQILKKHLEKMSKHTRGLKEKVYVRVRKAEPLNVDIYLQAKSEGVAKELAKIFTEAVTRDYAESVATGNAEKIDYLTKELQRATTELQAVDRSLFPDERKFKYIDMDQYLKDQAEMLRNLTVEEGVLIENVNANPMVSKLRGRVAELTAELAATADVQARTSLKVVLNDAQDRYNSALYLVKARTADKENNFAYSIKINKIKQELEYVAKHDKEIQLKIGLIKAGNLKVAELLKAREIIRANAQPAVAIEEIESVKVNSLPVNKRYRRILFVAALLGALCAAAVVIVLQYLGRGLVTRADVEQLGLVWWGVLDLKNTETHKLVRTQMSVDILQGTTSAFVCDAQGENAARALAAAYGAAGSKVLLIDANLRKVKDPTGPFFDWTNPSGWPAAVVVQEGYSFLDCGMAADAADVLARPAYAQLMTEVHAMYDFVFVLVPARVDIADPLLVAQLTTRVMYALDSQLYDGAHLQELALALTRVNKAPAGIIFVNA